MIPTPWQNPPAGLIAVGEVLTTRGVKGEVKVAPLTAYDGRWHELKRVLACSEREQIELTIENARFFRQFVLIKFCEIRTVEEAEQLKGLFLWIPKEERPPLPEGSYYLDELEGIRVYGESQEYLGTVTEVIPTGANDVYVLRGGPYGEILLPALKSVVLSVDLATGRMVVKLPAGLVEGVE
ncbi:MAG TPA: 16S rRNA processing protein RimM [Firmicutes bacterium]|nr:16S rRNA processing protein RimM [Bacillota bacterium]